MSVFVRPAVGGDIPAMVNLLGMLFRIEADFEPDPARQRAGLARLLESSSAWVWVAEADGRVVGMVSLQTLVSTAEGGNVGLIEDLVVADGWRGRGLGRELLTAVEHRAEEHGLTRLQLLADRDNQAALMFYRHQGWQGTRLIALRKVLPNTDEVPADR